MIWDQVTGFNLLTKDDMAKDATFQKVNSYLIAANDKILKDSRLVAAFTKLSGFSAYYKIYHEAAKSLTIYESYLAYDKLRNKQYIISFNPLILAAKKV